MKRESFIQPKEEKNPHPLKMVGLPSDLSLDQKITINGSVYVVHEITQNISDRGSDIVIRAYGLDMPIRRPSSSYLSWR